MKVRALPIILALSSIRNHLRLMGTFGEHSRSQGGREFLTTLSAGRALSVPLGSYPSAHVTKSEKRLGHAILVPSLNLHTLTDCLLPYLQGSTLQTSLLKRLTGFSTKPVLTMSRSSSELLPSLPTRMSIYLLGSWTYPNLLRGTLTFSKTTRFHELQTSTRIRRLE